MSQNPSEELAGLKVIIDRVVYHQDSTLPETKPHAFIYFLTIRNLSNRTVTMLGRKWIIQKENGSTEVIEGDKIVGKTPKIPPGQDFSYNSYHITAESSTASGSFYGIDDGGAVIHVKIPPFEMIIPDSKEGLETL